MLSKLRTFDAKYFAVDRGLLRDSSKQSYKGISLCSPHNYIVWGSILDHLFYTFIPTAMKPQRSDDGGLFRQVEMLLIPCPLHGEKPKLTLRGCMRTQVWAGGLQAGLCLAGLGRKNPGYL